VTLRVTGARHYPTPEQTASAMLTSIKPTLHCPPPAGPCCRQRPDIPLYPVCCIWRLCPAEWPHLSGSELWPPNDAALQQPGVAVCMLWWLSCMAVALIVGWHWGIRGQDLCCVIYVHLLCLLLLLLPSALRPAPTWASSTRSVHWPTAGGWPLQHAGPSPFQAGSAHCMTLKSSQSVFGGCPGTHFATPLLMPACLQV
jgi:hypothetical protein